VLGMCLIKKTIGRPPDTTTPVKRRPTFTSLRVPSRFRIDAC
jgi:hypothetical protein